MNWSEFLLGQLPEAIYFPLFMIFAKNLKEKRLLFILLMITEYFLLLRIFDYNIWFQVSYTFMIFVILKFLYKEISQITDIFTFMLSSLILMLITGLTYLLCTLFKSNLIITSIISRIIIFIFLFFNNYKLYKIQNIYKRFWNRNDKIKKKIKSITFRCWNLVFFNFMFYFLNIAINYVNNNYIYK